MTETAVRLPPAPRGGAALVVEHLSKRFGDRVAFDDVCFEVGYGEVFGFLGPNGAGKTTTVRTLGTLMPPLAIVALMSLNVITPSAGLALGLAAALLVVDGLGWRVVAAVFDRERLLAAGPA
jgi:hypothetical protein